MLKVIGGLSLALFVSLNTSAVNLESAAKNDVAPLAVTENFEILMVSWPNGRIIFYLRGSNFVKTFVGKQSVPGKRETETRQPPKRQEPRTALPSKSGPPEKVVESEGARIPVGQCAEVDDLVWAADKKIIKFRFEGVPDSIEDGFRYAIQLWNHRLNGRMVLTESPYARDYVIRMWSFLQRPDAPLGMTSRLPYIDPRSSRVTKFIDRAETWVNSNVSFSDPLAKTLGVHEVGHVLAILHVKPNIECSISPMVRFMSTDETIVRDPTFYEDIALTRLFGPKQDGAPKTKRQRELE